MAHSGTVIHMRNVPGKPLHRALDAPLFCTNYDGTPGQVPTDFEWDGSSAEILSTSKSRFKRALTFLFAAPLNIFMRSVFPRHRHPIASCRHDWRCLHAKNMEERLWADQQFQVDVGSTSWWITKKIGYAGVRAGAHLGIGNRF